MENTPSRFIEPQVPSNGEIIGHVSRPSRKRFAMAFAVAAFSDVLSLWTELVPPAQWIVDLITASLLFLILGRRWAILPGLIAEAIPGLAAFPIWILVVLSIVLYKK